MYYAVIKLYMYFNIYKNYACIHNSCFSFIINICMYAFQIAWFKNIVLQTKKKEINTNSKFD